MGARDIRGLAPAPSTDVFSEQVAHAVADQDELVRGRQEKKQPLLQQAALALAGGAALGGAVGAIKGGVVTGDAWNPKLTAAAALAGGAGGLGIVLLRRAAAKRLANQAQQSLAETPDAVRYVASHPGTQERARDWEFARWAPLIGAEVGALVGGVGGLALAPAGEPGETPSATSGLIGAGALGLAGLGLGYLYRRQKQTQFLEHVENELAMSKSPRAQEAAVEAGIEREPQAFPQEQLEKAALDMPKEARITGSSWPIVSTNAPMLNGHGGAPERYASGKYGARRVYDYGLGGLEAWKSAAKPLLEKHVKNEKLADDDANAHGEELDDVALGIARVLEEQHGSNVRQEAPPSTKAVDQSPPSTAIVDQAPPSEAVVNEAPPSTTKVAADNEPVVDDHGSAPQDKMRPRAELILWNREGVFALDKGDYVLFPGGGIDDGEQPRDAALRETLEEANRHAINVVNAGVVESVWPENSGNAFWDNSDFDGERTYFFSGVDAGEAGVTHADLEDFGVVGFDVIIAKLESLVERADQSWARRNNETRLKLVKHARRLAASKANLAPIKQAADGQEKLADAAQFLPRKEVLMFTPAGKLAIRRGVGRRFDLPSDIESKPVPYEQPVQLFPEGGVPEKGVHGYQVALHSAEGTLPEGFEEVDPQDALKDLYAALGKPENRSFQSLDRARARALLRLVKKRLATPAPVVA